MTTEVTLIIDVSHVITVEVKSHMCGKRRAFCRFWWNLSCGCRCQISV